MERKTRDERRKFRRWGISIPLSVKMWGTAMSPAPIGTETDNISWEGLSIVIKIKIRRKNRWLSIQGEKDSINLIPYLLLNNRVLELGIKILPEGRMIKGIGKVMWYHRGLRGDFYCLRAGIFMREMDSDYKEKWLEFLSTIARIQYDY